MLCCVGLQHIVTFAFFRAEYKYSAPSTSTRDEYLLTYLPLLSKDTEILVCEYGVCNGKDKVR